MAVLRRVRIELGHWVLLVIIFWPWRTWFMSAIASDDVIIVASGLRLHAEPGTLLPFELGIASTGSAHFLPLGGALTGTFLWAAFMLQDKTSLSVPEAWAMLSWLSMLLCWRVVAHFVVWMTGTTRVFATTLSVAALASLMLQIPGDFNLNAVLSFPVAGWITAAIAVWSVSTILERGGRISARFLIVLSTVAIMIYELLIVPILLAVCLSLILNRRGNRHSLLLLGSSGIALLIPLLHRFYYAISPQIGTYAGTTVNSSSSFFQGLSAGIMSSLSALPLGQLGSAARLGVVEVPDLTLRSVLLVCAASTFLWCKVEPGEDSETFKLGSLVLGLSALAAGSVFGMTAKYSAYFSEEWGRTYLNFPLAVVSLVVASLCFFVWVRRTTTGRIVAMSLLLALGLVHQSSNVLVVEKYRDHWNWATELLEDVPVAYDEVALCRHYRTIASQPLPNGYAKQLISYLDQFRQAQFGKGICPSFDRSRIVAFQVNGEVVSPEHQDSGSWWWLIGNSFEINVSFLDRPPNSLTLAVGSSPCNSPLSIEVGSAGRQEVRPSSGPTFVHVPLEGVDRDERGLWQVSLDGTISGWACMLEEDERTLVAPIFFPNSVTFVD